MYALLGLDTHYIGSSNVPSFSKLNNIIDGDAAVVCLSHAVCLLKTTHYAYDMYVYGVCYDYEHPHYSGKNVEKSATRSDVINNVVIIQIPTENLFVVVIIFWPLIPIIRQQARLRCHTGHSTACTETEIDLLRACGSYG